MESVKRVAVFSSRRYDNKYLKEANEKLYGSYIEFSFIECPLKEETVRLAEGYDAICVFVNDDINAKVLTTLKGYGINLIALRCAGFNNVDMKKAIELDIQVVRVPAYSPYAVAEHAVCLLLALNRKLKKSGFFIYSIGEITPPIAFFFLTGSGPIAGFLVVEGLLFSIVWVVLYAINFKHLNH